MTRRLLIPILLLTLSVGCISNKSIDIELQKFSSLFIGSFSTKEQAFKDASYKAIVLNITPVWENTSGYWMFAEWADGNDTSQIIQRRVIRFERLDSVTIVSKLYKLPENTKRITSDLIAEHVAKKISSKDLLLREGCDVKFTKQTSNIYVGKTERNTCESNRPGISYISSQIIISTNRLSAWTKGFDTKGKQVWGKINGPYLYKRIKD
ncbi:chromophore lyase CpcT/CpeT [Aquimarina sp. 2-A2]|uniref:chromophore lyase CpcT/CpeT n=1 Tax=Aquimarina sp. 2-A2 TaxID=3382644 RepID=UPI00387EEE45